MPWNSIKKKKSIEMLSILYNRNNSDSYNTNQQKTTNSNNDSTNTNTTNNNGTMSDDEDNCMSLILIGPLLRWKKEKL